MDADGEADADAGSEGRVGKEVRRGDTPRLEMSNGRGRKQEMWTRTALSPARARSLARSLACMQIETRGSAGRRGRGRGEGRKVLKQGKECPRQWRGRPRPPHHTNPALPEKGRIYLLLPRRCRFLFLPFLRKGNGGAKRSFITQAAAAAAAARPTGLFSSFFVLPPLSAQRSGGERAAS